MKTLLFKMFLFLTILIYLDTSEAQIGRFKQDPLLNTDFVSYDGGKTFDPDSKIIKNKRLNKFQYMDADIPSYYIEMLDFVDNEFPKNPYPLVFSDANNNGKIEIYRGVWSSEYDAVRIYELDTDLNCAIIDLPYYGIPWAIGDINGNEKADLVIQTGDPVTGNGSVKIYESLDEKSYPSVLIADIELTGSQIYYFAKIVDTDMDGKQEVLLSANSGAGGSLRIYEWEDDTLVLKWIAPDINHQTITKAVGDFDGDGQIEIATVLHNTSDGTVRAYNYECTGNDTYILVQSWVLPEQYIYLNCDAVDWINPDGGNPEFAIGVNYMLKDGRTALEYIFYKEINDVFRTCWTIQFPISDIWTSAIPKHVAGDFDKDGFDEIVIADYAASNLNIFEYDDGKMEIKYIINSAPVYLTNCIEKNIFMNFAAVNWGQFADTLIIYKCINPFSLNHTSFTKVSEFVLEQNYPNPFNPSTKIKYSVPQYSQVVVRVFDVLGNEIETLVNEEKPVGTYELTWNAAEVSSGVYLYKITAGEYSAIRKMLLIK